MLNEPVREKTNNLGSDQVRHKPGCTVTEDGYKLESSDLRKKRNCTICVAKTKALISFAVDLRLCFRLCRLLIFPCGGSNVINVILSTLSVKNDFIFKLDFL